MVRGLTPSERAMEALVRPSATSRRIWISRSVRSASQQPAMAVSTRPAFLASAGAQQRGCLRGPLHAEQGPVLVAEVAATPAQRDADDFPAGTGQVYHQLVFDGYAAEKLGVQAEAMELLPAEEVADHHRLAAAGCPARGHRIQADQTVTVTACGA